MKRLQDRASRIVFCISALALGCDAYQPLLCQPCQGNSSCGPGLTCSGGFCGSPADWCFEERGVTPFFPHTDGECDLLNSVGPVDPSKISVYAWHESSNLRAIVGAPGAAAPGTLRVAHRRGGPGTETGAAWVEPDGSFRMTNNVGAGELGSWYPIDDDGDQCGRAVEGSSKIFRRGTSNAIRFTCSSERPYATRRCEYVGPGYEKCEGREPSPDCPPPHGELCALTAECVIPESTFPFPFEETFAGRLVFELQFNSAALEPGSLLLALSSSGKFEFSVAGTDPPLLIRPHDTDALGNRFDWTLWVERPPGSSPESSEMFVLTASAADSLWRG